MGRAQGSRRAFVRPMTRASHKRLLYSPLSLLCSLIFPFSQPGNIFIKAGVYKLGDFGLVASVNSSDGLGDSLVEGDSRYMSAELLQDGPKDLTKCDIFSLGATVYEMGRGRALPPNGEEWHALRSGHPPSLKGEPAVLVSDLMRVLAQMMAVGS